MVKSALILGGLFFVCSCALKNTKAAQKEIPFRQENLIPWSIVAFDSKERTPTERVKMVKDLGFSQYAFGGREKHIATMEEEVKIAKEQGIKISAVWLYMHHKKDQPGKLKPMSEQVFQTLKKTGLKTQIWVGFYPKYVDGLDEKSALAKSAKMIDYLSKRANSVGCKIALYNHGGWFGEPENQLQIINSLPQHEIGIIYNFHHGHENLDRFPKIIDSIMPHLWAVNLNGMKKGGPKIMTIGKGDLEKKMIKTVLKKGFKGPFGILGHVKGGDAKVILKENLEGLEELFPQ